MQFRYWRCGYSREYPVEKMMRDAKIMQIFEEPPRCNGWSLPQHPPWQVDGKHLDGEQAPNIVLLLGKFRINYHCEKTRKTEKRPIRVHFVMKANGAYRNSIVHYITRSVNI